MKLKKNIQTIEKDMTRNKLPTNKEFLDQISRSIENY